MSYDYSPGDDGLVGLGYADFEPEGCYEWDGVTVYVRTEDKRFFWENGSGCSCNGPMEYVNKLEDFDSGTYAEFVAFLLERLGDELNSTWTTPGGKAAIITSVAEVLTEAAKFGEER